MTQYDFNLLDYWRIIKKRRFIIIFTVIALAAFSTVFAYLGQPAPLYKATASIKVEKSSSLTGLYIQAISWSQADDMQTQTAIVKSYYILELVAKRLNLIPKDSSSESIRQNTSCLNEIVNLKNKVEAEQEGNSNIINVMATAEEPKLAQNLANMVAEVYKEERVRDLNKRTIEAKQFIESQLNTVKERLSRAEEAACDFREKNKIISLDATTSNILGQAASARVAHDKALVDLQRITEVQKLLERVRTQPLTTKNSFSIEEGSAVYKSLNDRLVQLLLERDTLLIIYTHEFPQVVELQGRIDETINAMKAQLQSQARRLQEDIASLRRTMGVLDNQIKALPQKGLELARLEREIKINMEVYTLLEQKYQEALIKEAEKLEDVQIVRPALLPARPVNPPKTIATAGLGIIIGLILGIVFAFLIETLDTSIGTIEEVEKFLGIPVLGVIPHVNLKDMKESLQQEHAQKIDDSIAERAYRMVTHFAPKSTLAESYRALRTNLSFACRENAIKTIVFSSATPREGKTISVVNLAITMAQAGNKVLLVEADLRKPVISKMFGIEQVPGLSDVLLGNYEWDKAVRKIEDILVGALSIDEILETPGMDNVRIVPAGTIPLNPSELINSKTITDFLKWASAAYDFVLIDAPPLLAATDATILSSKVDAVVIVYRVGKISRGALKRAKTQLESVKATVLGVVLNGLRAELSSDISGYEYKYYHYYYHEKEKKQEKGLAAFVGVLKRGIKKISEFRTKPTTVPIEGESPPNEKKKSPLKAAMMMLAIVLLGGVFIYAAGFFSAPANKSGKDVQSVSRESGKALSEYKIRYRVQPNNNEAASVPAAEPVKKEEIAAPAKIAAKPYFIQIKSFQSKEGLDEYIKGLQEKGFETHWKQEETGNRTWYKVRLGHFETKVEATRFMKENHFEKNYPGSFIVLSEPE